MSRRRQKNNLLPKMIGVAVLINAILLPILAQMGVFKPSKQRLTRVTLIKLPPLEKKKQEHKTPPKKRVAKAKPHPVQRPGHQNLARAPKANPNQPKVVAAGKPSDNGNFVNNGTAQTGAIPNGAPTASNANTAPAAPLAQPAPPAAAEPPVEAAKPAPAPSHEPVIVAAAPLSKPQPELPDNLRNTDIHTTFEAQFFIHADGNATVKLKKSTGDDKLDSLALDAAKRWTFKPATKDGAPVDSYLNVEMDFDVS